MTTTTTPNLKTRLEAAVVSYLKGVRNELQFFEVLTKSVEQGGLGLAMEKANLTLSQINSFRDSVLASGKSLDDAIALYQGVDKSSSKKEVVTNKVEVLEIDTKESNTKIEHRFPIAIDRAYSLKDIIQLKEESSAHNMNAPLDKHIDYHRLELRKLELTAEKPKPQLTEPKKISAPVVEEKKPVIEEKKVVVSEKQPTAQQSNDIKFVEKKAVVQKVVPQQLSKIIESEAADAVVKNSLTPLQSVPKLTKPTVEKKSWWRRIFSKREKSITEKSPTAPERVPESRSTPVTPAPQALNARPRLEDVKYTPKVYGPIDELENLTIIDFRRISKNPNDAVRKLQDKLELLAQDSLELKAQGVKALKKSEPYRAYSGIMNVSLMEGKTFTEAVAKQDKITKEEFDAIMALNKQLSI